MADDDFSDPGGGWIPDLPDFRAFPVSRAVPAAAGPAPMLPIDLSQQYPFRRKKQLGRQACIGFGVAAALEYQLYEAGYLASPEVSPGYVWYGARLWDGTETLDHGTFWQSALRFVNYFGWCEEKEAPYDPAGYAVRPPQSAYLLAANRTGSAYHRGDLSADLIRSLLLAGLPVMVGFAAFDSFLSPETKATGIVPIPQPTEKRRFGHGVLIVGYDPDAANADGSKGRYKFLNWYGEEWGDKGYGYFLPTFLTPQYCGVYCWTIQGARM